MTAATTPAPQRAPNAEATPMPSTSLAGFAPPTAPLSPRVAFAGLGRAVRPLVAYDPASLWEHDTAQLPRGLRRYRRRVRAFADAELRPRALERDRAEHPPGDDELLVAAGRAGLLSDLLPTPLGSLAPGLLVRPLQFVQSLKMEELCAACGGLGLLIGAHGLGAMPLVLAGEFAPLRRFLVPANHANRRGDLRLFAFAITEPAGGSDVEETEAAGAYRPGTVARRAPGGWVLNGRKVFISNGSLARYVTVFAALEGRGLESWTCFLVESSAPGFRLGRDELKLGQRASPASELIFEELFVPDDRVIGGVGKGWAINRGVLNYSRIPVGSIALGIARGALERAVEFACQARLGGRALVHFQDVQLALAQMMIDTSAMRAMVWQSASAWVPRQAQASMTKVFCADTAVRVCEAAMELLGNHGYLRGGVEKAYRDARLTQIYEGTNQINRLAVIEDQAEQLMGRLAAQQEG